MPQKKTNAPEIQLEADEDVLLSRPAATAEDQPARRSAAGTGGALPSFLLRKEFEVLDTVNVSHREGRSPGGEMTVRASVPADDLALLVTRQRSGAILLHRPAETTAHAVRRGVSATKCVEFRIAVPNTPRGGAARRGWSGGREITAFLVRIVKKAVEPVVDRLAGAAVPLLGAELEERLWKNRAQGWLHVTQGGLMTGKFQEQVPNFGPTEKGLLLIHGTFSDTVGGFRDLAQDEFVEKIREIYGDRVYAYNHFTFSKTPEENVREMLAELPPGRCFTFDVITHSRGGLVLRTLTEGAAQLGPNAGTLRIGRAILVAAPNEGTPLVTPARWEEKLAWMANLLDMLPPNAFVTAADWLANALTWFTGKVVGHLPGLAAMNQRGDFIADLQDNAGPPLGSEYFAITSNFRPQKEWLARLADMGLDAFFGEPNDLVVPTAGGWKTSANESGWIPPERIACFGPDGNVGLDNPQIPTHVDFFKQPDTKAVILKILRREPLDLPVISRRRVSRSGDSRRSQAEESGKPPAAPRPEPVPPAAPAGPPSAFPNGWDDDDLLSLTIVARANAPDMENSPTPVLLATYGSARVAAPLYTKDLVGDDQAVSVEILHQRNAGNRWRRITAMQKWMVDYTNGKDNLETMTHREVDGTVVTFDEPTEAFLEVMGRLLFETLFAGEVKRLYDAARFSHRKRRLNIVFTSMIPWIADIPWELAFDPGSKNFLSTSDVRFVRNVLSPIPADRIPGSAGKLRILVVSAQPSGSAHVSSGQESSRIIDAFKPLISLGLAEVRAIPRSTPELLHECLRELPDGQEFDVVHFIGHGLYDQRTHTGYVLFENDDGSERRVSASELLDILRGRGIRLVCLNACETGRGESADYNKGVAMVLARDGIPAVVANQYSVVDSSASLFALHFYACLASGLGVADAVREARIAVRYSESDPMDWGVPVLFARNPKATLCARNNATLAKLAQGGFTDSLSSGNRRKHLAHPIRVGVWCMSYQLARRERLHETLDALNEAQESFGFVVKERSVPAYLWTTDKPNGYLNTVKIDNRLDRIREKMGVNHLVCVTDLPLKDQEKRDLCWTAIAGAGGGCVILLSTSGLTPELAGDLFKRALANCLGVGLTEALSQLKHDHLYPYTDREVSRIAAAVEFGEAVRETIANTDLVSPEQMAAIQAIMRTFQPDFPKPPPPNSDPQP